MEITPEEVQRSRQAGDSLALIDIREPSEIALCRIEGAALLPMREIPGNLAALQALAADGKQVVLFCHHGVRSLQAVRWLRGQGLGDCLSMSGGIDAWSEAVDSAVPRY